MMVAMPSLTVMMMTVMRWCGVDDDDDDDENADGDNNGVAIEQQKFSEIPEVIIL